MYTQFKVFLQISWMLLLSISVSPVFSSNKTINLDAELKLEWIRVPGGSFMMGSPEGEGESDERPQHEENVATLDVLKSEVTVKQFRQCVQNNQCWSSIDYNSTTCNYDKPKKLDFPINCIDWYQANVFCAWIDARLPSEAEWEYIASNQGKNTTYPWGEQPLDCDMAVIGLEAKQNCSKGWTEKVCSKPKGHNQQGICDLIGNVYEWVSDWYYLDYYNHQGETPPPIINLLNKKWSTNRIMRGGGVNSEEGPRVRNRIFHHPHFKYSGLGVRCVRTIGPEATPKLRPLAGVKTVTADQVSNKDASGTPWNKNPNIIVPKHGLKVKYPKTIKIKYIDTSLDNNDTYTFEFYLNNEIQGQTIFRPQNRSEGGLAHNRQALPDNVTHNGFDLIIITPEGGDNMYSLGHIILE